MGVKRSKVTMSDVARASSVSLSTVSLVLNEKPGIPAETRSKVINAARSLGYEMRAATPASHKPTTLQTIGMLVKRAQGDSAPPSSNIFFSHIMAGIETGCRRENISLLFSTLPVDESNTCIEIPRLIQDERVDGLILVGNYVDEQLNAALRQRGVPVVLVDAYCSSGSYDAITIDNVDGAYHATRYLIDQGHREIAFVGSFPDSRISFRYRRQGYAQALEEAGIHQGYYADCPHNHRQAVINATARLVQENPQVTALFGCNDEVAILAMHGALEAGKRVPEDISIIGFDDNANAPNTIPPLTTMHVDKIGMGRLAVQLMVHRAENPEQGIVDMQMHTHLVERKSVRALNED